MLTKVKTKGREGHVGRMSHRDNTKPIAEQATLKPCASEACT